MVHKIPMANAKVEDGVGVEVEVEVEMEASCAENVYRMH